MLIFGDARLPVAARQKLSSFGIFVPFATSGITYDAISGHPDIFFCQNNRQLVVASNLPEHYLALLESHRISFVKSSFPAGKAYPETAVFNAVVTGKFLIHNPKYTDPVIKEVFADREIIQVKQGYTRCNLLALNENLFITSDKGIYETLKKHSLEVHYFSPEGILLPGFSHGFLGGCLGISENRIFITGSLSSFPEGEKLKRLLNRWRYKIVELYDGPLFDGGSLFFFTT